MLEDLVWFFGLWDVVVEEKRRQLLIPLLIAPDRVLTAFGALNSRLGAEGHRSQLSKCLRQLG